MWFLPKKEDSEAFQKVSESLNEIELEVSEKYAKELKAITEPNSSTRKEIDHWFESRFKQIKNGSHNDTFSCGVLYGLIVSEAYRFERAKISLSLALKKE